MRRLSSSLQRLRRVVSVYAMILLAATATTRTHATNVWKYFPTVDVPTAIAAGPDGNIWFATDGTIGRIKSGTTVIDFFATPTPGPISGIASGPDGQLWFTEVDNIGSISVDGSSISEFPIPTSDSGADAIVSGPDGNLWFTEQHAGQIGRISTAGVFTEFKLKTAHAEPSGLTVGSDGRLWFTELDGNKIGQITVDGAITESRTLSACAEPQAIAAGGDRDAWVAFDASTQICHLSETGALIKSYDLSYTAQGIALATDGNVWFTGEASGPVDGLTGRVGQINVLNGKIDEYVYPLPGGAPGQLIVGPNETLWFIDEGAAFDPGIAELIPDVIFANNFDH